MKFFMDFEATRFSNQIIEIGCVAENGATFQTYVNPGPKEKVDYFITELTGITNEMLSEAPGADKAFNALADFFEANSDKHEPEYFVYGNCDSAFLYATLKHMEDTRACLCAQAVAGNMVNYASVVKRFFVAKTDLALRKVYMLIQEQDELVQHHDALEDAQMLSVVVSRLYDKCKPEDRDTILAMPSQKRPSTKKAPAIFQKWNEQPKWEADTGADENQWVLKCVDQHSGQVKYFKDLNTAALWVIKYIAHNVSPKKDEAVKKIEVALSAATQSGKCRYNSFWEYSPEGAITEMSK